jgi:hypothetical protein
VLTPGEWLELFELDNLQSTLAVGLQSTNVEMMIRNTLRGCRAQLTDILREAEFVNIHSNHKGVPVGRSAGQDGIDGSTNYVTAMHKLMFPVWRAGGYGYVQNEEESGDRRRKSGW